jgi:hypothetical protein
MNKSNVWATGKGVAATYGSTSLFVVCAVVFLPPALLQCSKDEPVCGTSLPHVRANYCSRSEILRHSASLRAHRLLPSRARVTLTSVTASAATEPPHQLPPQLRPGKPHTRRQQQRPPRAQRLQAQSVKVAKSARAAKFNFNMWRQTL